MSIWKKIEAFNHQRMRSAAETMSPMSWLLMNAVVPVSFLVLFRPSWAEFGMLLAVDVVCLVVAKKLEISLFQRRYPDSQLYFPQVQEERIARLGENEKLQLFESMLRLPDRRSVWCLWASVLKVMPASIMIVCLWHVDGSRTLQFFKCLAHILMVHTYFYATVYFDNHYYASSLIRDLHQKYDWSKVFRTVRFPDSLSDFNFQERLSLTAIFFAILYLQAVLLFTHRAHLGAWQLAEFVGLGIFCFLILARTWVLARGFFMNGLLSLFATFREISEKGAESSVPLHSSYVLARFENIFNELTHNLRKNERELTSWMVHETEQSRYRALGEVAGLVVHDLAGPLHTLQFCVDELRERREFCPSYFEQIGINTKRSVELISSLRAYLRNPGSKSSGECTFESAHESVLRLLQTQFAGQSYRRVSFRGVDQVKGLRIKMDQSDLIHLLYNLYKNSLKNFAEHEVNGPFIEVRAEEVGNGLVSLHICDNGTGLDRESFERFTALGFSSKADALARKGMGLRLTRRLVERLGGSMGVSNPPGGGTDFQIVLPATVEKWLFTTPASLEPKVVPEGSVTL